MNLKRHPLFNSGNKYKNKCPFVADDKLLTFWNIYK